jgi:cystathionine gamma-synthase
VFRNFLDAELQENDIFWGEDAIALEANSRDFPKRVRRTSQNAAALVDFLKSHPLVDEVYYPNAAEPSIAAILREGAGLGCLLSFTLKNPADAPKVYDALRVGKGPSLGTNFTLVCPYTLLAHYTELDWAASCGVAANLLRVSVGLEEIGDLKERFAVALNAAG